METKAQGAILATAVMFMVGLIAACEDPDALATPRRPTEDTLLAPVQTADGSPSATPAPPTPAPASSRRVPSDRCVAASPSLISNLKLHIGTGVVVEEVYLVRSRQNPEIWFIGAKLRYADMATQLEPGLWVTNQPDGTRTILSVNKTAAMVSQWADARTLDEALTVTSDGAREAMGCAG